jgi:hypothetical protein
VDDIEIGVDDNNNFAKLALLYSEKNLELGGGMGNKSLHNE